MRDAVTWWDWPAVDHHGPCVGQSLGLDSPDEAQQASGMIGHAVVGPAREVELPDLPDLMSAPLRNRVTCSTRRVQRHAGRRSRVGSQAPDWMQTCAPRSARWRTHLDKEIMYTAHILFMAVKVERLATHLRMWNLFSAGHIQPLRNLTFPKILSDKPLRLKFSCQITIVVFYRCYFTGRIQINPNCGAVKKHYCYDKSSLTSDVWLIHQVTLVAAMSHVCWYGSKTNLHLYLQESQSNTFKMQFQSFYAVAEMWPWGNWISLIRNQTHNLLKSEA